MTAPTTLRAALAAAQHENDKASAFYKTCADLAERVCGSPHATQQQRDDAVDLYLFAEQARREAAAVLRSLKEVIG